MMVGADAVAGGAARLVREPLEGPAVVLPAARWLRREPRGVALSGEWAGGGLILTSHPIARASETDDPFDLLDAAPLDVSRCLDSTVVGGGWFGWFGFGLAGALEDIGPPPPRPHPLALCDLAFHDHLVRCDSEGRWWFEALWTDTRAQALRERLECWRRRLAGPIPEAERFDADPLRISASGAGGHRAAVAETIERIWQGELSQANVCLRLESQLEGDPLDLWVQGAVACRPAYAAYVSGGDSAILSLSPELFLRRRGRHVQSRPIKGTRSGSSDPAALASSGKDRAENVMIVDLMRNDLGRVCKYGSVGVRELCSVQPAAGVWHLVSTVQGTLRGDVGDGELLRATFPPGSVTGAPKVQALKVIHELEATAREAYCGAIGVCSPALGLELNVAIRTFEVAGNRLWLGAGGGIVADSAPASEVQEALDKARGVAAATGLRVQPPRHVHTSPRGPIVRGRRPDPALGLIETIRVTDGQPDWLAAHVARLRDSCRALRTPVPVGIERAIISAAAALRSGALRVTLCDGSVRIETRPLPPDGPVQLEPVVLPGGLGAHKWADRALINALSRGATTPLFCDLDGSVLEAGHAAAMIIFDRTLIAAPCDARILPSISRNHVLRAARRIGIDTIVKPFDVDQALGADALILTSSLRGPHVGILPWGRFRPEAQGLCDELARAVARPLRTHDHEGQESYL